VQCPSEGAPEPGYVRDFLAEYRGIVGEFGSDERTAHALKSGMEKGYFLERKSRVNRALRGALGHHAEPYVVRSFGRRPHTGYGLGLDPDRVRWERGRVRRPGRTEGQERGRKDEG